MKIDPVVIHDAANKWVKGKPEPADKMREEYNPLMGFRSRDDLSCRWKTVADFLGQIPGLPKLFDILLPDGRGHPLHPASDLDIFGGTLWAEKTNAWALGLERGGMDEQRKKKAWVKNGVLIPL